MAKEATAATVNIANDATVTSLTLNSAAAVTGEGKVTSATINASGATIAQTPQTVSVAPSVTTTVGGKETTNTSTTTTTTTNTTTTTTTSSGGGGGGGGSSTVTISAIDVTTVTAGSTRNITVTTNPSDATITASSNNTARATVSVSGNTITITGAQAGLVTVTVTASKSGYNNGTTTFNVTVNPAAPSQLAISTASGSLIIGFDSIKDQYNNVITYQQAIDNYGLSLANSRIYLTTGAGVSSTVYGTLQGLGNRIDAAAHQVTILDADLTAMGSGDGIDGMFVGFNQSVHGYVYAVITGTKDGIPWTISDSEAMPSGGGLTALTLSEGTLSPVFAQGTTSYTASVPNATTSITVTPTAAGTITVNGTPETSGQPSHSISLTVGVNTITVVVTEPGKSPKTYTIVVTRASALNQATIATTVASGSATFSQGAAAAALVLNVTETAADGSAVANPDLSAAVVKNGVTVLTGTANCTVDDGANTITLTQAYLNTLLNADSPVTITIEKTAGGLTTTQTITVQ